MIDPKEEGEFCFKQKLTVSYGTSHLVVCYTLQLKYRFNSL